MYRQLKQTACPYPNRLSRPDHWADLQGIMTAAHPGTDLAVPGYRAVECCARR
jgi:hypothetical protein